MKEKERRKGKGMNFVQYNFVQEKVKTLFDCSVRELADQSDSQIRPPLTSISCQSVMSHRQAGPVGFCRRR